MPMLPAWRSPLTTCDPAMRVPSDRIFRQDSVRRYVDARERTVLPRLVRPRWFAFLWAGVALLALAVALAATSGVPVYVAGTGTVVELHGPGAADRELAILAALPGASLPSLREGQMLWLRPESDQHRLGRPVRVVSKAVIGPTEVNAWLGGSFRGSSPLTRPSAVLMASLRPLPPGKRAAAYLGSTYSVEVEVGRCTLLALALGFGAPACRADESSR